MKQRPFLKLTPQKSLTMTFALQNALNILQMNNLELSEYILKEVEKNPLLEIHQKRPRNYFEKEIASTPTLYEHILSQIRENFSSPLERLIAMDLLDHLDEKGFVTCPVTASSEKVLKVLQTFDPPGIFARNLQETILIQLSKHSPCYKLVENCFEDLLHGRFAKIKKKLNITTLNLHDLQKINPRPVSSFSKDPSPIIVPDIRIEKTESGWAFELLEEEMPKISIREEYCELSLKSLEEKEQLKVFKTDASNLCRSLKRRSHLLKEITRKLICKQARFLNQKGDLFPLTSLELAEELHIHESTLSRALSGKYAITPRGVIPLRSLLSARPVTQSAIEILQQQIKEENKQNPLTDSDLAKILQSKGFIVARRTIAKYRKELHLGPAAKRKQYK